MDTSTNVVWEKPKHPDPVYWEDLKVGEWFTTPDMVYPRVKLDSQRFLRFPVSGFTEGMPEVYSIRRCRPGLTLYRVEVELRCKWLLEHK